MNTCTCMKMKSQPKRSFLLFFVPVFREADCGWLWRVMAFCGDTLLIMIGQPLGMLRIGCFLLVQSVLSDWPCQFESPCFQPPPDWSPKRTRSPLHVSWKLLATPSFSPSPLLPIPTVLGRRGPWQRFSSGGCLRAEAAGPATVVCDWNEKRWQSGDGVRCWTRWKSVKDFP